MEITFFYRYLKFGKIEYLKEKTTYFILVI